MRLSVIFVITLAISVIISSAATWGLTYSTSYDELRDMSKGFEVLATSAVDNFRQLVQKLIGDYSTVVSDLLSTQYNRSMSQLNQSEQELLQITLELMAQTKNATAQSQGLVASLVVSFGNLVTSIIAEFTVSGTDDASRLRTESAYRAQLMINDMLQNAAMAIKRTSQLYTMSLVNLSRSLDQPFDDGSIALMGSLCFPAAELGVALYFGTAGGVKVDCNATYRASNWLLQRGAVADNYTTLFCSPSTSAANFASWKQACLAGQLPVNGVATAVKVCPHGVGAIYPTYCNGTCGYDPRCRPWYSMHSTAAVPQTRMTDPYIDRFTGSAVVTLSYPIYSRSSQLLAVSATDFFLNKVDTYLGTLGASQLVAVVFNTSGLLVMGTSRACPNSTSHSSGQPIAASCDPTLQLLGSWLAPNRNLMGNVSLELAGTLWDVFPGAVDSFSFFVAVGMNKTEVYAVVTATSEAANQTLQTLSQQQSARMARTEVDSLAQMEKMSADKVASLHAMEVAYQQYMQAEYVRMDATFNTSRQQSAANLDLLTTTEMDAIAQLEDYHLSKVKNSIGVTFGSVVGIFAGVLLVASYGTWAVTKQVENIAQVMEDVAQMRVEQLEVVQKSPIREVQRIEAALGVLVARLAEYKTYMPAGLFQAGNAEPPDGSDHNSPKDLPLARKCSRGSATSSSPHPTKAFSVASNSHASERSSARPGAVVGCTRLLRRSAVAMAVNVVRFKAEAAQRSSSHLELMLNRVISVVHSVASKVQGNIDAIVGDQLLVTFNAHFACSDPSTAASTAALEVVATLAGDAVFPWRVQIGLAAGAVYTGHLGYASFKSMVALGTPLKVASLLSHLSGFEKSVALACPSLEERIKYTFNLQPVDLVALPMIGEYNALYAKSITTFVLVERAGKNSGTQEWLYEVGGDEGFRGRWATLFREVTKAPSLEKAAVDLQRHIGEHPEDWLAVRLLTRLAQWQPRVGIILAERPDMPRVAPSGDSLPFKLSVSDL